MLLKRRLLAYTAAPVLIAFLILAGVPILVTPVVQTARGEAAAWGAAVPIGILTAALIAALVWLLATMRGTERRIELPHREG